VETILLEVNEYEKGMPEERTMLEKAKKPWFITWVKY